MQTTTASHVTGLPTRTEGPSRADMFREALIQAPALICITRGPEHTIDTVNELYLRSIGGRDVTGLPMARALPDSRSDHLAAFDQAYLTGIPYTGKEVPITVSTDKASEARLFDLTVQPLKDAGGIVFGLMIHAIDVTENVRSRTELSNLAFALERSNRELDSFAYAASHDLRAPLRGIANLAQWIEEDLLATDHLKQDTREMLELLRLRMHRMEGLIEGLLQYSRAGRLHQQAEQVDVGELVQIVVDLLSPPASVSISVAADLPHIKTERLLLQQVFMNLINNAIKHAQRDSITIEISSRRVGPFYEFAVSDDGPGIAPEFHDRIWGIFQTLETRDRVEGAGIGLALVKKLVESQQGRVWVESLPGEGATFKFLWRKEP